MTKSKVLEIAQSHENIARNAQFEYHFVEFKEQIEVKISDKAFTDNLGSQNIETVESKANAIIANGGENRSKILCYFNADKTTDQKKIKVQLSQYACHNVAVSKEHYACGVIVFCITSDDQLIIGSRDASRAKNDPQNYPMQAPCGFMENYPIGDESAFDKLLDKSLSYQEFVIENGIRELKEEILPFEDCEIIKKELIGGVLVLRDWPEKNPQNPDQPSTKKIANFKSLIVVIKVSLSFEEIQQLRQTSRKPKDYHEITLIEGLTRAQINEYSLGKKPTEIAIDFDGKIRKFAAEHCLVLPIANLYNEPTTLTSTACNSISSSITLASNKTKQAST